MTVTVKDIVTQLEEIAPPSYAIDGDRIGLHVGSFDHKVNRVMVTLDVLEKVVDEAIEKNVDLIIAHHPLIFRPLKQIDLNDEKGKIIKKLITHNITVYVAHTNLDIVQNGVNDMLVDELQLKNSRVLVEMGKEKLFKFVVFVPTTHEDIVRDALANAGAGHIGNYSHCTFNSTGQGTFKPLEGTNPYIGSTNELEKVDEIRMETIVPESKLNSVVEHARAAHPYEEMAYDIYPLHLEGEAYGLGRLAELEEEMTLKQFASYVKEKLNVPFVRMVGDENEIIKKIGVIGGDGNKYIYDAKKSGSDVLLTGDIYFHTAHDALGIGLSMIDPGHHIEQVMKKQLAKLLIDQMNDKVEIIYSEVATEPFQIV